MRDEKNKIREQLEKKRKRLEAIQHPDELHEILGETARHNVLLRYEKAQIFLEEISELLPMLEYTSQEVYLSTLPAMNKLIEKADFSRMDLDGEYCKIAYIQLAPYPDIQLVFVESLGKI